MVIIIRYTLRFILHHVTCNAMVSVTGAMKLPGGDTKMKKPFFVERIGGIPTVLKRGDDANVQVAQHQTMRDAKAEAARRNLNAEFAPSDI